MERFELTDLKPQAVTINGRAFPVTITCSVEIDDSADWFAEIDSWGGYTEAERADMKQGLERGTSEFAIISVTAGIEGTPFAAADVLGGCLVSCAADLQTTVQDNDMVANALDELEQQVKDTLAKVS